MKANAPERIYIPQNDTLESGLEDFWVDHKVFGTEIEYVRKDAFIEKALDYIENNIYDHYDGDNEYGICGGYVKKEEFIKNFEKYIEGE